MEADVVARLRLVAAALEAKKAYHILVLDVSERTSIADAFVICSAGSQRQAHAVADEVDRTLAAHGAHALAVEGYGQAGWILLDYGDLIVHVFLEERREFYALERLWGDAPEITAMLRVSGS